jgi:proteasome lid subunit RPN8/RPN11
MISIDSNVLNIIIDHAKHDLPNEACGYLAGKDGVITKSYSLVNIDKSPEHYSFNPEEQFATLKKVRREGLEILANYHSHPATPARPSVEDILLAYDPDIHYFIVSLAGPVPVVKAFRIVDGNAETVSIKII